MSDGAIKAQYEAMRMTILTSYLNHPAAFNEAYVFAWYHRMQPLALASDNELEFETATSISISQVGMVLATVKQLELARRFDDLCQTTLPGRVPHVPDEHIHTILSYLNLKGDLSYEVVSALEAHINSPTLARGFSPEDVKLPG